MHGRLDARRDIRFVSETAGKSAGLDCNQRVIRNSWRSPDHETLGVQLIKSCGYRPSCGHHKNGIFTRTDRSKCRAERFEISTQGRLSAATRCRKGHET